MIDQYANAARQYRPGCVRVLFVAEAPPADPTQYFYFPKVIRGDSLWVELMKALYPGSFGPTKSERAKKSHWLKRFAEDGFFLIDAAKSPIPAGTASAKRISLISAIADIRTAEIAEIAPLAIVLVKATVFDGLSDSLRSADLPLLHDRLIPFPGSGQQARFQTAMNEMILPRLGSYMVANS